MRIGSISKASSAAAFAKTYDNSNIPYGFKTDLLDNTNIYIVQN
ncbi:hypothetical protein [Paraliobacillus zengyii]|nr:hypothetical protein [Paraliobacillus zengyii]